MPCPKNYSITKTALTACSSAFIGAFKCLSIVGGRGNHDLQAISGRLVKLQYFWGVGSSSNKSISEHTEVRVEPGLEPHYLLVNRQAVKTVKQI
jgi:hypothetical protein